MPKTGKLLGKEFWTGRGLTHRDPTSPMIFNIVVDAVVQAVSYLVCGIQESQKRLVMGGGGEEPDLLR